MIPFLNLIVDHYSSFAVIGGIPYLIHMLGLLSRVGNDEGFLGFGRVNVQRSKQNGDLITVQTQLNPLNVKHRLDVRAQRGLKEIT